MVADDVVSLDPEEADAAITRWRAYAQDLQRHGAQDPALVAHLHAALGDTYAEFIDMKVVEQQARQAAYARVAAQADAHADKLATTRANLASGDEDVAARFGTLAAD